MAVTNPGYIHCVSSVLETPSEAIFELESSSFALKPGKAQILTFEIDHHQHRGFPCNCSICLWPRLTSSLASSAKGQMLRTTSSCSGQCLSTVGGRKEGNT